MTAPTDDDLHAALRTLDGCDLPEAGRAAVAVLRRDLELLVRAARRAHFLDTTTGGRDWCDLHPRRLQANTVRYLAGRQDADGDLCLACEVRRLEGEREALRDVVLKLLLSADADWERQGPGHDWREAVARARGVLHGGGDQ